MTKLKPSRLNLTALLVVLTGCGQASPWHDSPDRDPDNETTTTPFPLPAPVEPDSCQQAKVMAAADALPVTPIKDYVFPLMEGQLGSAWCMCRDIGTSPHIGQDFKSGRVQKTSIAMANLTVVSKRFLGSCGWEIVGQDQGGAKWRFLHLDEPTHLVPGSKVWRGEIVGKHSRYPANGGGCGAGTHLHLERFSKGILAGEATSNTCQNGRKQCNFDPRTIFVNKPAVQTEAERLRVVAASKGTTPPPAPTPPVANCVPCSKSQPLAPVLSDAPLATDRDPSRLTARVDILRQGLRRVVKVTAEMPANKTNACAANTECAIRWELQVQKQDGTWARLFSDQSVRNRKLVLPLTSGYCLSSDFAESFRVLVTTDKGHVFWTDGQAQSLPAGAR